SLYSSAFENSESSIKRPCPPSGVYSPRCPYLNQILHEIALPRGLSNGQFGEAGTRSSCPGPKETHRGRFYARLDGVCPRTRAQQHSAFCGESRVSSSRKFPETKKRYVKRFIIICGFC
ncbi:hypothetical protein PO909_024480, partial [Leuciscus waleckii]